MATHSECEPDDVFDPSESAAPENSDAISDEEEDNAEPIEINVAEVTELFFGGSSSQEQACAGAATAAAPVQAIPACGCRDECLKQFSSARITESRLNFMEMEKEKEQKECNLTGTY